MAKIYARGDLIPPNYLLDLALILLEGTGVTLTDNGDNTYTIDTDLSALSTDDLPEGTDPEHFYNQVGNVEESTHADRIDIGALQANIHGIYAGLLTNFILMHTRVGNNTTELDGGIGYNPDDGFYIWEGSTKNKFITGIDIKEWEDGRPYLTFEGGNYRYWLHNGSSLENVDGVPRFYNMKEGTIGAIPVPQVKTAGGW